jgi:hypothetical protein
MTARVEKLAQQIASLEESIFGALQALKSGFPPWYRCAVRSISQCLQPRRNLNEGAKPFC